MSLTAFRSVTPRKDPYLKMASYLYAITLFGLLVFQLVREIVSALSAYSFKRAHGCKPEYKLPQPDRFIGLGLYRIRQKALLDRKVIQVARERYSEHGPTFSSVLLGLKLYNTIDPENVKAILATNFNDFGLGARLHTFGPLLGKGIFTSDGAAWENSRVTASDQKEPNAANSEHRHLLDQALLERK